MNKALWLEPEYYNEFACKCGECRHACCKTWKIAVREDEYYRLIGMECSVKLHERLEAAFCRPEFPTPEKYMYIEPDWRGQCRMLDDDGMCMIQKECGEAALTELCRVYPRSLKSENGKLQTCCSASCERTVELLMKAESLRFVYRELEAPVEISEQVDPNLSDISAGVIAVLQDRTMPLRDRIARICTDMGGSVGGAAPKLEQLPVFLDELCEGCESLRKYANEVRERYGGPDAAARYEADEREFAELFPDWECRFENLICNNVFYADFPCVDSRIGEADACSGLVLQYALLKQICVAWSAEHKTEEDFVDAAAACYHLFEHTPFYYNAKVLLNNIGSDPVPRADTVFSDRSRSEVQK